MARKKTAAAERREEEAARHAETVGESQVAAERARSEAIEATNRAAIENPGATRSAHGEAAPKSRAGGTVVVGCKLGIAFIDLQLTALVDVQENTQTGPRTIKQPQRYGPVVRIRGTAYPRGTPPLGFPEKPVIVDGAALNFGISEEFWEKWVEVNKLNPLVVNKMIFAHANVDFVKGQASETKGVLSGLDPVNPLKDPRTPRSTRADLANVETEETRLDSIKRLANNP